MRESFGVGLSELGDGLTWGEAKLLIEEASGDGSTALGAELANWAYQATMPDLLGIVAAIGNKRAAMSVMPWAMKNPRAQKSNATPEEVAAAEAELEAGIVFS